MWVKFTKHISVGKIHQTIKNKICKQNTTEIMIITFCEINLVLRMLNDVKSISCFEQ